MKIKSTDSGPQFHEYFVQPTCPESAADEAYRTYLTEGMEPGGDFGHWLARKAWGQLGVCLDELTGAEEEDGPAGAALG